MPETNQAALLEAITDALTQSGMTQGEFGAAVARHEGPDVPAYRQQTVAGWLTAKAYLAPARIFAMEKALALRPGTLSQLEGYVPNELTHAGAVTKALVADPDLTDSQVTLLEGAVEAMRDQTRQRRAARRAT